MKDFITNRRIRASFVRVIGTEGEQLGILDLREAIRKAANSNRVSSVTTVEAALAAVNGLWEQRLSEVEVCSLQEYHGR